MKITLAILTYNEVEALGKMINKLDLKEVDEYFAVDGGSTDGTLEIYKKNNIPVVQQISKKGRGEAFKLAIENCKTEGIIFFSPDGNEDPKDIKKFKPFLEQGNDMVIASRMMEGAHNEEDESFLKLRKWVNNIFNFAANLFFKKTGKSITDSINGFRAIRVSIWNKIKPTEAGYPIEYQMTIRALKNRLKILEFPTNEGLRIGGESKAKAIPTGIAFVKCFIRELFSK